ncbi:hypothetical protein BKA70DRAFT_1359027 [Coprinopsis sp. MPI-PUGE-AT-0042]|nr:hypothetical protein BKA70DRAFT_1359027 [Coprinopsis sp. MPI-PUGE-AT-0042]
MAQIAEVQSVNSPEVGGVKPIKKKVGYWAKRKAAAKKKKEQAKAAQPHVPPSGTEAVLPTVEGPVNDFFAAYAEFSFQYDPRQAAHDEFHRLCEIMKVAGPTDFDRESSMKAFSRALVAQFNFRFGTNVDNLANWQSICVTLGIEPVPQELKQAKEAVCNKHINLVDLTTSFEGIRSVTEFPSEKALSQYTLGSRPKKIFPREAVEDDTILWFLLRKIYRPPPEGSRRDEKSQII